MQANERGACGAQCDRSLRIGIDRDRAVEALGQSLRYPRNPGRSADEKDGLESLGFQSRRIQCIIEGVDRAVHRRGDHVLEFRARQTNGRSLGWDEYGDRGLGVEGECLLRVDALTTQLRERQPGVDVIDRDRLDVQTRRGQHMPHHRVVEVGAAQVVDAHRRADDVERTVDLLAKNNGIECASSEVVDGERLARLQLS